MNNNAPNGGFPPGTIFYPIYTQQPGPTTGPPGNYPFNPVYQPYPHTSYFLPPQSQNDQWPPRPASPPQGPPPPAPGPSTPAKAASKAQELASKAEPAGVVMIHFIATPIDFTRRNAPFHFYPREFPVSDTVGDVVKQLSEHAGKGVMEVHELGDGEWSAGQRFMVGEKEAEMSLESVGWLPRRKCVWLLGVK